MSLQKTGYTDKSAKSYILNAAVAYKGVTFEGGDFSGELIGATAGGVNIAIEQTYRDIEVDGTSHMKVKGNKVLESANATIVAKLKELTAENLRLALNGSMKDAEETEALAGFKVIETKRYVEDADYIENVAFVGQRAEDGKVVVAIIDNALVTTGLTIETEDNNEAVVEVTFEAHADYDQLTADKFPWRIYVNGEAGE